MSQEQSRSFVWCMPCTEDEINEVLHEIIRQRDKSQSMVAALLEAKETLQFIIAAIDKAAGTRKL